MIVARSLAALLIATTVSACKFEHTNVEAASNNVVRGEGESLKVPSEPSALAAALGVTVDSLRPAGEERYNNGEYDSARAIWQVEIIRAQRAADSVAEARARMWLGLAEWHLGDFKSARHDGETAVHMKRHLGLDAELSKSYNALGLLAWQEGRYREALVQFDSAVVAARRNGDATAAARAASNIPLIEVELGDFDAARIGFSRAINDGRDLKDDRLLGNALANLAMLEIRLGNGAQALPLLAEARQHYAKIHDRTGEANALGQISTAWSELGDLQRAIASADSGLTIAKAEGLQQEIAATLEVLADLEAQAGDLRRSLQLLRGADSLDAIMGLALEQGTNQRRMSAVLTELGESAPAVARARTALAMHRKVLARHEEGYDRMQLAHALALSGDNVTARREADSALRIAVETKNPAAIRDAAGVSAELALIAGNYRAALSYLDRAEQAKASDDWRLSDLRATALLKSGQLSPARASALRALRGLERERASLGAGPLRSGYLASRSAPFSHAIEIELARGDTAAAFTVAASLPGRALSERFGGVVRPGKSITVATARESRLMRIAALERELTESRHDNDPPEKQRALATVLETERSAFEDQLNREATLPDTVAVGWRSLSLAAAKQALGPGEAMLLFISGPERLDIFAVTSTSARHRVASISERALGQRVRLAREVINRSSNAASVPRPLADLFELLIRPAIESGSLHGASRLTIIAQGSLGALPFAALWNKQTGRFLVEDYVIRYLPAPTALSIHDDTVGGVPNGVMVFAPLPDSLPGTRTEARAIASAFPNAETRIGPAATEERFRAALLQNRAVHVASHGSHNSQNPLFSRMIVGRSGSSSTSNDGRVEVHEILGLVTNVPLVFLSGCETAVGSAGDGAFVQGSQEASLAYAFLIAGARTVVATLWRIDDASASVIAESFYHHLRRGAPADQALALAQREALAKRRSFTWAAYDVFGFPSRN